MNSLIGAHETAAPDHDVTRRGSCKGCSQNIRLTPEGMDNKMKSALG